MTVPSRDPYGRRGNTSPKRVFGSQNRGGQATAAFRNDEYSTPKNEAPVLPGRWPWEEDDNTWSALQIRNHLEQYFYEKNLLTTESARDLLSSLADAHFTLQMARRAIAIDPLEPTLGKRDAYSVQSICHKDIQSAMKAMGLWPLTRSPDTGKVGDDSTPHDELDGHSLDAFKQPRH